MLPLVISVPVGLQNMCILWATAQWLSAG